MFTSQSKINSSTLYCINMNVYFTVPQWDDLMNGQLP